MRVVLDTNVMISSFVFAGRLNRVANQFLRHRFEWLVSREIIEEYLKVLGRPAFHWARDLLPWVLFQIKERAILVDVSTKVEMIIQDPTDNKFLACAIDGRADYLVSGDRHLLALHRFRGVPITSPTKFLGLLK